MVASAPIPVPQGTPQGLIINKPNPEQMKEWADLADKLYPRIRGHMVPADTFDEVFAHLKAYRASLGQ